jgi:hypothetical protein
VPDAHITAKHVHVMLTEDITYQTVLFSQIELVAVTGHHARCILAAMLQHREGIIHVITDI